MSTLAIKKDKLIRVLQDQLKLAEAHDKQTIANHKAAEKEMLREFHDRCRAAIKWDYETAQRHYFKAGLNNRGAVCPRLMAPQFERAIQRLELDNRMAFKLSSEGQDADLFMLATWTPNPGPQTACD